MTLKERLGLSDRDILAKTLQAEAGNQGTQGMLAAGSVIMNRTKSSGYGGGVQDVILKPGQFSPWNSETNYAGGAQGQDMINLTPSREAYQVADNLLSGNYKDPTGGATHFYNPDISNPSWGAEKQGGDWTRINSHLFGKADAGRSSNQLVADDAMRAIGKQPIGFAGANIKENSQMMQQQRPRGLLADFGIQKMQEGAEGETGQRFYNRDTFKDRLADLAVAFGKMGIMGLDEPAAAVANRRAARRDKNKTVEYLMANGREDLAGAVRAGTLTPRDAAGIMFAKPKNDRTSLQKNYEFFIAQGMSPEAAMDAVRSGTTIINPGQKGIDEFEKLDAKALASVAETGMSASRSLNQINRLESLLTNIETGAGSAIKSIVGNFGIKTEGLDDIQAATALINTLVPQQRAPGSGPMSDADLELFKQSLPRIINTPQGNRIIIETMRGVAEYDAMGSRIVQKYRSGEITKSQAFAELQNRPDPFVNFRADPKQTTPTQDQRKAAKELLEGN